MDAIPDVGALFTPEGRRNPVPHYAALHEHGPALRVSENSVAVSGYAAVEQALRSPVFEIKDADYFRRTRPGWVERPSIALLADSMIRTRSPHHERLRRLASQPFTARRVTALEPAIHHLTDQLLDRLAELGIGGRPVDFMTEFAYPLPIAVICELLGVPTADHDWLQSRTAAMTMVLGPDEASRDLAAADAAASDLTAYFAGLVAHRREQPADDLVSALVEVRDGDGDRLSERELLANLSLVFAAGLLGNGLAQLLEHPDERARLVSSPATAPAYVEEVLRYDPPVHLTTRRVVADTSVGGIPVAKDEQIVLLLGAANRDPRRFATPNRFDPNRQDNRPITFGDGPHFCLGAALARLEARVVFPRLLARCPHIASAGSPTRMERPTLRGYATFPVEVC